MSRFGLVGSNIYDPLSSDPKYNTLLADPGAPRYAIMKVPGGRSTSMETDRRTYVLELTTEEMVEAVWRWRGFDATLTYTIPEVVGSSPGVHVEVSGSITYAEENELQYASFFPHPFINATLTGTVTYTITPDPPFEQPFSVNVFFGILNKTTFVVDDGDTNPYVHDTSSGLWYPKICIQSIDNPRFANSVIPADTNPVPQYVVQTFECTVLGQSMDFDVRTDGTMSAFDFSLEPATWWSYRDASGNNPIWDADTGVQLRNVITGELL